MEFKLHNMDKCMILTHLANVIKTVNALVLAFWIVSCIVVVFILKYNAMIYISSITTTFLLGSVVVYYILSRSEIYCFRLFNDMVLDLSSKTLIYAGACGDVTRVDLSKCKVLKAIDYKVAYKVIIHNEESKTFHYIFCNKDILDYLYSLNSFKIKESLVMNTSCIEFVKVREKL